jgi:phenylalanyl-tRNA synthetase beta chain
MAVVEFYKKDIEKLSGIKLTEDVIKNKIPMIGCPLEKIDNEKLHFEVFPDRPDMLSAEGFTRAVGGFISKGSYEKFSPKTSKITLYVDKSVQSVRPYIATAVVRNVKFTSETIESLIQVQEKIHDTIGRKRKKVAIGVHDLDRVKPPFYYEAVHPEKIKFIPLDMKEKMNLKEICKKHPKGEYCKIIEKSSKWPVILDKNGDVLSFPPVINGELTRVSGKTRNIFIDVTGTSKDSINQALNIIVTSLYKRGFKVETVLNVINGKRYATPDLREKTVKVNIDYLNKLLDSDFTNAEIKNLLEKMGLSMVPSKKRIIEVLIPPYRADVMHPIDIAEDIAIAFGYENFEPRIPRVPAISRSLEVNDFSIFVKTILTGLGFQEIISMILTSKENEFEKMNIKKEDVCETLNPVSIECTICRKHLLPSVIKTFSQNQHVEFPQKIFEIGETLYVDAKEETGARTSRRLCCAISDTHAGYEQISAVLDSIFRNIGINYELKESNHPSFIEGRTADIISKGLKIGVIGEINPQVLQNWNLEMPAAAFEINMDIVFERLL